MPAICLVDVVDLVSKLTISQQEVDEVQIIEDGKFIQPNLLSFKALHELSK